MKLVLSIAILVIISFFAGYQLKSTQYNGKTAQEWASTNTSLSKKYSALQVSSQADYNYWKLCELALKYAPTPTPKVIIQAPQVDLPPGCQEIINAYMNDGYSRSMTNQLLKQANPQCTY